MRAALEAHILKIAREVCAQREEDQGSVWTPFKFRKGERDETSDVRLAVVAVRAALSTPVPEEGLPRGSASAAEGELRAALERIARCDTGLVSTPTMIIAGLMRIAQDALASAEAGGGAASALPSPLPSQGDPVAWVGRRSLEGLKDGSCQSAVIRPLCTDIFAVSVPLYTAEALAAAKARADRAEEDERDRLLQRATAESNGLNGLAEEEAWGAAVWLGRNGAVMPEKRAALRARNILKETSDV